MITKDEAAFWLDKNGRWQNAHGEFEHKKIIDYFHASIRRDEKGYYLFQKRDAIEEKVYFRYEDTALFAIDLIKGQDIVLILNTGKQVPLKPRNLFIKDDNLYMTLGAETIKFTDRGLMKIADLLEEDSNQYAIRAGGRKYKIKEL